MVLLGFLEIPQFPDLGVTNQKWKSGAALRGSRPGNPGTGPGMLLWG